MQFFEDLEVGKVERFGHYEVTREEVIDFARKYDPQPFHLDDEAAAKTFFKRVSASGWHTCAMTMSMIVEKQQQDQHQGNGSPGLEELRFLRPVYPRDTLSCEREILEKRRSKSHTDLGVFRMRISTCNQHGEKVMSWLGNAFIRVREAG
jgi:acyl dehydratase